VDQLFASTLDLSKKLICETLTNHDILNNLVYHRRKRLSRYTWFPERYNINILKTNETALINMKCCKNDEDLKMTILTELNRIQKIITLVVISRLQDIISKELLGHMQRQMQLMELIVKNNSKLG